MQFEIYKAPPSEAAQLGGKPWRWRLVTKAGQVVAYGEGYKSKLDCEDAVTKVMNSSMDTPVRYV